MAAPSDEQELGWRTAPSRRVSFHMVRGIGGKHTAQELWTDGQPRSERARRRSSQGRDSIGLMHESALAFFEESTAEQDQAVWARAMNPSVVDLVVEGEDDDVLAAAHWLGEADAVLVVAGSGASSQQGMSVFTSTADFRRHYPFMARHGYTSGKQALGILSDDTVSEEVKWGYLLRLARDARFEFPAPQHLQTLRSLVGCRDYYVLSTAADGVFLRAPGWDPDRVYTPNGDWGKLQCAMPCRRSAVWDAQLHFGSLLLQSPRTGALRPGAAPRCGDCGGCVAPAVRSTSRGFLHDPHDAAQQRLVDWVERLREGRRSLCIVELGAGQGQARAGRWPAESIARELGERCFLVRINPTDSCVPQDIPCAVGLARDCSVLGELVLPDEHHRIGRQRAADRVETRRKRDRGLASAAELWESVRDRLGHFDWRVFLHTLRGIRPPDAAPS
eukprot:TRINITY_DN11467_c0_g1_i1.p1 TRINITY_DN11467_c0_g1~~TRINITY_DN11467_c0_g1_i1.p1  ORF type:complete len:446 (+),score=121.75 TRINITY_DN11467_c0_g1_i1:73-1410(+)